MTERDFVYWLQGWLEMEKPKSITGEKLQMIKDHLDLVFERVAGRARQEAKDPPKEPEKSPPASPPMTEKDVRKLLNDAARRFNPNKRIC